MAKKDLYKNTDYFEFTQPNPTEGNRCKKPDCVIRAFAIAADLSWQESYDILSALARENYDVPNSKNIYEKAFKERPQRNSPNPIQRGGSSLASHPISVRWSMERSGTDGIVGINASTRSI